MPDRNAAVKAGHRSGQGRGRISLYENEIGFLLGEYLVQLCHHARADIGRRLIISHYLEIRIGVNLECFEKRL